MKTFVKAWKLSPISLQLCLCSKLIQGMHLNYPSKGTPPYVFMRIFSIFHKYFIHVLMKLCCAVGIFIFILTTSWDMMWRPQAFKMHQKLRTHLLPTVCRDQYGLWLLELYTQNYFFCLQPQAPAMPRYELFWTQEQPRLLKCILPGGN